MADPQATAPAPVPADAPPVRLLQNLISILGFLLIAVGVVLIVTFALFSALTPRSNPYLDIVGYMILPGVLIGGLTLVPLGMLFRFWRLRRKGSTQRVSYRLPALDLHDPHMRRRVLAFAAFTLFVVFPVLGFSSYEGYIYTESTQFCGQTCHSVMAPEATAHANSPHARVTCAECHIGAGADWFVKAKISGLRQVYAVWANTYSRPIPPAITELRPARDTCEECHWPAKFYGSMYKEIVHFSPDEENTRRPVRMLLKVGGADESIGRVEGIHMHMVQAGKIEYVATDAGLQNIPWVRYTPANGAARTFRSDGQANDAPAPAGLVRRVDCMDCHNRGAHHFRAPQTAVDLYLNVNRIDPTLPFIKREAVLALLGNRADATPANSGGTAGTSGTAPADTAAAPADAAAAPASTAATPADAAAAKRPVVATPPYADAEAADAGIVAALTKFYEEQYPQIWATRRADVERSARAVCELYHRTFFPQMRVDWRTYPENIGHLNSAGCFRCHDGLHIDASGTAISSTCETCHTFLNPVEGKPDQLVMGPFQHSMSLAQHPLLRCNQCHNGGDLALCRDCHAGQDWLKLWGQGKFRREP